jgi:hypothetical protein
MRLLDRLVPLLELCAYCALVALVALDGPGPTWVNVLAAVFVGVVVRFGQRATGLTYLHDL